MSGFWMDVDGTTIHVNGDDTPEVRAAMADLIRAVRSRRRDNPDDPAAQPEPQEPREDADIAYGQATGADGIYPTRGGMALSTPADEPLERRRAVVRRCIHGRTERQVCAKCNRGES